MEPGLLEPFVLSPCRRDSSCIHGSHSYKHNSHLETAKTSNTVYVIAPVEDVLPFAACGGAVNFTVYDDGHPYVVTSNGNILGLGYTATQYVTIKIDEDKVIEHFAVSVTVGVTAAASYILESTEVGAALGSVVPGAGTLVGAAVGFIAGVIVYELFKAHEG